MTTFNFSAAKDTLDLRSHAGNVVEAATGTRHNPQKYSIIEVDDPDGESVNLAVDFAPDIKETPRSGTRGAARGIRRGGF